MPKFLWFFIVPVLCLVGCNSVKLGEPAYSNLKRELETEGVEVLNIERLGNTRLYLEIALNKPDDASARETETRVENRLVAYAKPVRDANGTHSGNLGFIVHSVTIQFSSPTTYFSMELENE